MKGWIDVCIRLEISTSSDADLPVCNLQKCSFTAAEKLAKELDRQLRGNGSNGKVRRTRAFGDGSVSRDSGIISQAAVGEEVCRNSCVSVIMHPVVAERTRVFRGKKIGETPELCLCKLWERRFLETPLYVRERILI